MYHTTSNLISKWLCVVGIIAAFNVKISIPKILIRSKLRSGTRHLSSSASHSEFLITSVLPATTYSFSFSISLLFLSFGAHGIVIIFPGPFVFHLLCILHMCFWGTSLSSSLWIICENKSRERVISHPPWAHSSSRENKVQFLRVTTTDNRYYQTRNPRVDCKSKQHNVQSNR